MARQSVPAPSPWRNRIVAYSDEPPDQLLASPFNWRIHPQDQQDALLGVLKEAGIVQNILVNRTTGNLVDGHLRVSLALREGQPTVPVTWVELSEDEEKLVLSVLDPIATLAVADKEKLDALLRDVQPESAALQQMLSDLAAREGLYTGNGAGTLEDIPEPRIDRAEELQEQWGTKLGQLWGIESKTVPGKSHRLLCGDCRHPEDIKRLMSGEIAEIMFTDPPYGVDYTGGHFHSGDVNIKRERPRLDGDKNADLYSTFLPVVLPYVNGPCYMWFADANHGREVYNAVYDAGCQVHALLIWNKVNAKYAAMNAQYKQRHEPMLYFKPRSSTLRWTGPTDECTVWDMPRDPSNDYHPTQKPVALPLRAFGNHDAKLAIDPFIGSGSTIVAAEQLGKLCYGCEIDPGYVAVTLQRLADMSLTPRLLEP